MSWLKEVIFFKDDRSKGQPRRSNLNSHFVIYTWNVHTYILFIVNQHTAAWHSYCTRSL